MSDELFMSYEAMADMAARFTAGSQQLQDTMGTVQKIVSTLQGGALLGTAGEALANAFQASAMKALQNASAKLDEMAADVNGAMVDIQTSDSTGAGMF
jgi:WXG100 family type VII secretion target